MKWEQYRKLSLNKKIEYDYRFKDSIKFPDAGVYILIALLLYVSSTLVLFAVYVLLKSGSWDLIKDKVFIILDVYPKFMALFAFATIISYLIEVGFAFWKMKKHQKWVKENAGSPN